MKYSQLTGHFDSLPKWKVGQTVNPGDFIGFIGNSGYSDGKHVHKQDAVGFHRFPFHSWDFESGKVVAAPEQTLLEITGNYQDMGLFGCEPKILAPYHSYTYFKRYGKHHYGYDVNPVDMKYNKVYWNRSFNATVLAVGYDDGFGYYIILGYKVG